MKVINFITAGLLCACLTFSGCETTANTSSAVKRTGAGATVGAGVGKIAENTAVGAVYGAVMDEQSEQRAAVAEQRAAAWYYDNSGNTTHAVGTKQANELGIYDMSGNVWEWCSDWYGDYPASAQNNPTGPSSGSYRVYRGGSWSYFASYCRVAYRYYNSPGSSYHFLGFRLVVP